MVDAPALIEATVAPSIEGATSGRARRRVLLVATLGAWLLGVSWSLMTPVMGAYDENQHMIKAVSIWHGQLRGKGVVVPVQPGETIAPRMDGVQVPSDDASLQQVHGCFVSHGRTPDCAPSARGDHERLVTALTAAGPYPPLYYVLVGWPTRLVAAPLDLYLMRVVSAACSAAFIGLALLALRRITTARVATAVIAVGAVPMVWFLAGVVNPNGLEATAGLAMWSTWMVWAGDLSRGVRSPRWLVVGAVLSGLALGNLRSLGPGLVLLVMMTVWAVRRPRRDAWRSAAPVIVPVALGTLVGAAWVVREGHLQAVPGSRVGTGDPVLWELARRVPEWLMQTFADVGWGEVRVRSVAILCLATIVGLVALARRHGSSAESTAAFALLGAVLAAPVVLQLPSATSAGIAWQGRYLLAALLGVPVLCAAALERTNADLDCTLQKWWRAIAWVSAAGWLATLVAAARHYRLGGGSGFFLLDGRWSPPLAVAGVLLLGAAGAAMLLRTGRMERA